MDQVRIPIKELVEEGIDAVREKYLPAGHSPVNFIYTTDYLIIEHALDESPAYEKPAYVPKKRK